jgi:molecular chaperone GrpE
MLDSEAKGNDEELLEALAAGEVAEGLENGVDEALAGDENFCEETVTIDTLQAQLDQANDRVLRAQAELENVRKRARRDMDEQRRYANLPLVSDLLRAFDNLDRAVEAAERNENATGLLEGVKMVAVQIQTILEQHNCRRIAVGRGETFDPHVHQAIAQEPSDEVPAGSITRGLQAGYQLHDRVIRPSQVMVSTGAPQPPTNEEQPRTD